MNKAILVGAFHEMVELCELTGIELVGIIDNNLKGNFLGYPILGTDADAQTLFQNYHDIPLILSPDRPVLRVQLVEIYNLPGFSFRSVISPRATVSPSAFIGKGVVVQSGVNVSASTVIKDFAKLNVSANIMHDSIVGSFTTVAPNAVVLGKVHIGERCYIGANATILPNRVVNDDAVVGAGSVVTRDIDSFITVKGNPARA